MKIILFKVLLIILLVPFSSFAQKSTFQDQLLDHLTGTWVLHGKIEGKETTHDITADWVLGHQYVKFTEVSREKEPDGQPSYEAIVFFGWDEPSGQYACFWLDNTSGAGLSAPLIGHAKKDSSTLAFLFRGVDESSFHTTFRYEGGTDTWQCLMDGEESGKLQPFARMIMKRK